MLFVMLTQYLHYLQTYMTFDIPFPGDLTGWCCWCEHWAQGRATRHSRERRGLMLTRAKGGAEFTQHSRARLRSVWADKVLGA